MTKFETMCETYKHKQQVQKIMNKVIKSLVDKSINHDNSKLEDYEVDIFTEYTPKLADCTYGSKEYKRFLNGMGGALEHHYANNTHHPEHFINGIKDMNLIELIEMICDWKAATMRHVDGDIFKSIELNQGRFGYDDSFKAILENTAIFLNDMDN